MDISNLSADNFRIYISSRNFENLMGMLNIGDLVKGRVVDNLGSGKYVINFLGHNLISQSEVALNKADIIYSKVTDISDKVTMQLIPGEGKGVSESLSDRQISDLLETLNLKTSQQNVDIVKTLSAFGMKVNADTINEFQAVLKKFDLSSLNDMQAVGALLSKNIPLSKDAINSMKEYLFGNNLLGENMKQLEESFSGLSKEFSVKNILDVMNNLRVNLEKQSADTQLEMFIKNSGLNYENNIRRLLADEIGTIVEKQESINVSDQLGKALKNIAGFLSQFENSSNMELSRLSKEIISLVNRENLPLKDFQKLLLNVFELSKVEKSLNTDADFKQLTTQLDSAIAGSKDQNLTRLYDVLKNVNLQWDKLAGQLEVVKASDQSQLARLAIAFEKDVKYFFFSGNESALSKVVSRLDSLEKFNLADMADFKKSISDLLDMGRENTTKDSFVSLLSKMPIARREQISNDPTLTEDFKGNLLKLKEDMTALIKQNPELLKNDNVSKTMDLIDRTIRTVQGEQLNNIKADNNYVYYSMQIPLSDKENVDTAKIELFYKKKEREGKGKEADQQGTFKVAFFLDMRFLGPIKIVADVSDKRIDCQIKVTDETIKTLLDDGKKELLADFKEMAYESVTIECVLEDKKEFNIFESQIRDVTSDRLSNINIIV